MSAGFESLFIDDFSKGLDLTTALNKVERGYTPDASNFRITEYGGLEKTLGYSAFKTMSAAANDMHYYENAAGTTKRLIVASTTDWKTVDNAGNAVQIRTGMSAYDHTMFYQYEDDLYGINPVNNLAKWSGSGSVTTFAPGVNTGPPQGVLLGIWGNRMWVSTGTSMRVNFSTAGVFTGTNSWPADNYVTLGGGSKNTEFIIGGIPTPDGLMVFTYDSVYLIYDQNTGANRLLSGDTGCISRRSLTLIGPYVYGISERGIFRASAAGLELISDRIAPLFTRDAPTNLFAASGCHWGDDSYLISIGRDAVTPDMLFEVNTKTGAIMAIDFPAMAMVRANGFLTGAEHDQLFFVDGTNQTLVRRGFDGGTFAGSPIAAYYFAPMDPLGEERVFKRMRRVRVVGQGTFTVGVYCDYKTTPEATATVTPSGGSSTTTQEGFADVSARGRRHAIHIAETGSTTTTARDILGASGGTAGGVQLSLIEAMFSRTSTRMQKT